jgi:hypothetical protein
LLKADLHIHTCYSPDCTTPLEAIIGCCLELGINCIAVTDHNTIAGGLEMQKCAPFTVIVGEEIKTPYGEIIGLFLSQEIPYGLSPQETVSRIKAQGGLVCIPHPFDRVRRSRLQRQIIDAILPQTDIIEVFNSRTTLLRDSARAQTFARSHGLLASAGSDAHTSYEIGHAYVEMPDFSGVVDFRQALAQGVIVGRRSNPWVHLASSLAKWRRRLAESKASSV